MSLNTGSNNTGGQGYVGVTLESTYGVFVAPSTDQFLTVDAPPTLDSKYDMQVGEVYANSVDTNKQQRTGKAKVGGGLSHSLYANMGIPLWVSAMGQNSLKSAQTGDTIASIATANGISTIGLTTGGTTYNLGAWVEIGTGASQEIRQVITWNSGTSTLTVAACTLVHANGEAVSLPQQIHITTGPTSSLRSVSVEENVGNVYSWQYAGGYVDKITTKGQKDKIQVTESILFGVQRVRPTTPTPYAVTSLTDQDLRNAFNYNDGFLVTGNDQYATGTSGLSPILLAEDFSIEIDNKCQQIPTMDGTDVYRVFPGGQRSVGINFTLLNSANRQAIWEDYFKQNAEAAFFASLARNIGTPSNPTWTALGFYAPNTHVQDSKEIKALGNPIGEQVKSLARNNGSANSLELWVLNSQIAAY